MRSAAAVICIASLGACASESETSFNYPPVYSPAGMTFSEVVGNFSITCARPTKHGTGEVIGRNECFLAQASRLNSAELRITADRRGYRVERPHSVDAFVCGYGPREHGVDGTSLLGLSYSRQIELLSSGATYFKSSQRLWPDCFVGTTTFDLAGFDVAYARFMKAAKAHGL